MIMTSITDRIANVQGDFGINYINLNNGQRLFCGNCHMFSASGAAKLMVLIQCFKEIEENKIAFEETYRLKKSDYIVDDEPTYGALNYLHEGIELTIEDLCNLMITVSDNMAFNILVDVLGMESINETFEALGYSNMRINRKMFDAQKMEKGIDNTISIKEMARIFEKMYKGQIVSETASERMLKLMQKHQRTNIMPYNFPENKKIAHQTGYDETVIIDGGIVFGRHPFVLTMGAAKMDLRKAETIMRDITQICYEGTK